MNTSMSSLRVGWIGLGAMGLPMCLHLARGGVSVRAIDRLQDRVDAAVGQGVAPAISVADAALGADVVFSMVFDDDALMDVVDGPRGVVDAMAPGKVFVDMSTVSPSASARVAQLLEKRGIRYVRAPISGSVSLAQAAQLTVLVSGERADFAEVQPLLALFSQSQHHVGPRESARGVKLAINLMVAGSTALIGEALAFGEEQGITRDVMVDALNASIVGSRHYAARAQSLKSRAYNGNGPLHLVAKDLDLALGIARSLGLHLAITEYARARLAELVEAGHCDTEVSVLAESARPPLDKRP